MMLAHTVAHYLEQIVQRLQAGRVAGFAPGSFDELLRAEIESAAEADDARRWDAKTGPPQFPPEVRGLVAAYLLGQMIQTGGTKDAKVSAAITYADELLRQLDGRAA